MPHRAVVGVDSDCPTSSADRSPSDPGNILRQLATSSANGQHFPSIVRIFCLSPARSTTLIFFLPITGVSLRWPTPSARPQSATFIWTLLADYQRRLSARSLGDAVRIGS
jgi:hypothetical protein